MRVGLAILLRGLWFHRGTAAAVFVSGLVTVAAAVAAPLWADASEQSLLRRALAGGAADATSYAVSATANTPGPFFGSRSGVVAESQVRDASVLPADLEHRFDPAVVSLQTTRRLEVVASPLSWSQDGDPTPGLGRLAWREGTCDHLRVVRGRCPTDAREVMVSDRSAELLQVQVGDQVRLPELWTEPTPAGQRDPFPVDYTVSGVYGAASVRTGDRYWFESRPTEFTPATTRSGEELPARFDTVFATRDLLKALQRTGVEGTAERALRPGTVPLGDADHVERRLRLHLDAANGDSHGVEHRSTLPEVLEQAAAERALVRTSSVLIGGQVVLIGWVVLFGLVSVSVNGRQGEIALAKLRGMSGRRVSAAALGQPVAMLATATPVGVAAGVLLVDALQKAALQPPAALRLTTTAVLSVGATVLGAAAAAALAALRSLRTPVGEQLQRAGPPVGQGSGRVVGAVVVTLAAASISVVVSTGRQASGVWLAVLMPTLTGLAAGLLLARLVLLLARLASRAATPSALPAFLALRQVGRRPATARVCALVTAVITFTGFAAASWTIADRERRVQAGLDVGAAAVAVVEPLQPAQLLAAVRDADPQGRWAMSAIETDPANGRDVQRLLAVDSGRFTSVARGATTGPLLSDTEAAALRPPGSTPTLNVQGSTWVLDVDVERLASELQIALVVRAVTTTGNAVAVSFRPRNGGAQALTAEVRQCLPGCVIDRIELVRVSGSKGPMAGALVLSGLRVDGRAVDAFEADDWRPTLLEPGVLDSFTPSSTLESSGDGLTLSFAVAPGGAPGAVRKDVPEVVPAVVGRATALRQTGLDGLVEGASFGDVTPPFRVRRAVPVLPRLAGEGAVVDLATVARVAPADRPDLLHQVWLGDAAPPDAQERLQAAGLRIVSVHTAAERRHVLDQQGSALALVLLLLAAGIVLVAGLAGVTTAMAAHARRRAVETAALRALAVTDSHLRRSVRFEHVLLMLPSVLVGAVCAGVTAVASADVLASATHASALSVSWTDAAVWVPVVSVALVATALLAVVSAVAGRIQLATGGLERTREAGG